MPKPILQQSQTPYSTRNQPIEPLDPAEEVINDLEKMDNALNHSNTGDDTTRRNPSADQVCAEPLNEVERRLIRTTRAHAEMIDDLQADNNSLIDQLSDAIAKLDRLEITVAQMQGGQLPKGPNAGMFDDNTKYDQLMTLHDPDFMRSAAALHAETWETTNSGQALDQWHDMSDIAATLAATPKSPPSTSSRSSSSSSSLHSVRQRRKPSRPHRGEHVKRSRITWDRNGGQTPDISPTAISFPVCVCHQQEAHILAKKNTGPQNSPVKESTSDDSEDAEATEADETLESSLTSWLFDKASKALFGQ